jgi:hypothetical protein
MSMPLNLFPFNAVLRLAGAAECTKQPCQGSRVVAEPQEFCGLLEKPELYMQVHCFEAGLVPDARSFGLWQHGASRNYLRT